MSVYIPKDTFLSQCHIKIMVVLLGYDYCICQIRIKSGEETFEKDYSL